MTPNEDLAVLTPEHSVLEAMDLMVKYNVRHVPVVSYWAGSGSSSTSHSTDRDLGTGSLSVCPGGCCTTGRCGSMML